MTAAPDPAEGRRERLTHQLFQPDVAASMNDAYAWVARVGVPQFVQILMRMRDEHREAMAMRALHAFALRRPVDELVELAHHFERRDAVMLMATAALSRPIGEAAQLAVLQHEAEAYETRAPITASIVHDVACQRTAFDVAVFVRVLQPARPRLAERTVEVFAGAGSGRTNLDKALLHTALRDEGCQGAADRLLELTLETIARTPSDGTAGPGTKHAEDGEEIADLAGAFQHLSPAGQILESWVEARLKASDATQVDLTRQLLAKLIARRGDGHDALAAHVGRTTAPLHVVKLCALLAGQENAPAKCALVRGHAAEHQAVQDLAALVAYWHKEPVLTSRTRDLLADIVTNPAAADGAPRSLDELRQLDEWLPLYDASAECSRLLRHVAAVHVQGRTGQEIVSLLDWIERSRERTRAADEAGRHLAQALMKEGADRNWFVQCLYALHEARHAAAVESACRELSDPSRGLHVDAALVADVAGRLYRARLEKVSWDLFERFLENEQLVSPTDVVEVVAGVLALPLPQAELLLRATVGRWSDVGHRDQAVDELRDAGQHQAAEWVIKSLR
ncbi:hypothetical protein AB0J38_33385 [Streptomyces sp. NPDC050095]|uniref:hypothetical protein n=1 Tax=unclassified Streptomyces TaxID=2593676 RepID=UPI00344497CC